MFTLLRNVYSYLTGRNEEQNDDADEEFLAQELLQLEIDNETATYEDNRLLPQSTSDYFERTGAVSYLADDHGLIDGMIYFDKDCTTNLHLSVGEKVRYLAQKNADDSIKVIRVIQTLGPLWDDEQVESDQKEFNIREHTVIGKVERRDQRIVILKENNVKFNLDDVDAKIIPVKGDWLELACKVQWDHESPFDVQGKQIVEVLSVKPLRSRITSCRVQQWNGSEGSCSGQVCFTKHSLQAGFSPTVGDKVIVEAIESDQGSCTWRAITVVPENLSASTESNTTPEVDQDNETFLIEKEKNIAVTNHITFTNVDYNEKKSITLEIANNSPNAYILLKWKLMSSRHSSQLIVEPFINKKTFIHPGKSFKFTIVCQPKVLGASREQLILVFSTFQVKRFINITVVHKNMQSSVLNGKTTNEPFKMNTKDHNMRTLQQRRQNGAFVSGVRPVKPPSFVPVKLGGFPIPSKLWDAVIGDSNETIYSSEFESILTRIEKTVPSLSAQLKITNYTDRWHALLYTEEIQQNMQIKRYDMAKAFLTPSDGYLKLQIEGLSEKRPSLMCGDRVYVNDIWNVDVPDYEGYIHNIKGDDVYIKFNAEFHERYTGYDVKIEFQFSRTSYRKCHQAINLAIAHLGPNVLFPSQTLKTQPQLNDGRISKMSWYNTSLNPGQKEAVVNVLRGISRPMPYCIFGPPGTGKTVTIVETVLQIVNLIPDSRILIASPSNSSANLLTERLLQYEDKVSGSLIRLIAHYLVDSETLPDSIKPYCATLDIARENTAKSKYSVNDYGVNLSCRANFVGRHRITIGTCGCLGSLAQMELPRGHFTHVLVDEAGQANEPEIMIPLTFIDKDSGQIILAGDPMQLGPIVLSKYSREFGFDQSYLERLLERVPYQKDFDAFGETGFDNRLITRLTYNYRSVPQVISLCSEMFYDSSLVPQVKNEDDWIASVLRNIHDVLPRNHDNELTGGIFMYGVKGINTRAVDSPSWFNPHEATMLLLQACKLYKRNLTPDDIGIITPYIAQIKYLRQLFESTGTPQPKIGTVEEFQGQERKIILLSTVRSSESQLEADSKFSLGFVKSPKRLNVALTRAQVAIIMFGEPHLLSRDALWRRVIQYVVDCGHYAGCNLPNDLACAAD